MFRNLIRSWFRQTLEEAIRKKMAQMAASAAQQAPSPGQPKAPETTSCGSAEGESGQEMEKPAPWPSPANQTTGSTAIQKGPSPSASNEPTAWDVGVVFALESESGGLEDLVQETGRWRGDGFSVIGGRLENRRILIVRSGAGQAAAAHATEALLDGHRPRWVISAGFAGALRPELQRYDLVAPEVVVRMDGACRKLSPPEDWFRQSLFRPLHRGSLLSIDHLVSTPKEKQALAEKTGAWAVEMETFAVVETCQRRGTPVLAVRIIIDLLDEHLPPEVRGLLKQKTAAARWGAALGALWHRPSSFKDLYRLKENALLASDRLAKFLAWAIAALPT